MNPSKKRRLDYASTVLCRPFHPPLRNNLDSPSHPLPAPLSKQFDTNGNEQEEYNVLLKSHSSLQLQLTNLRQQLDTAQQATQILRGNQLEGLDQQVRKWRTVAQEAADELFLIFRERVDQHGGLEMWKRNTRERDRTNRFDNVRVDDHQCRAADREDRDGHERDELKLVSERDGELLSPDVTRNDHQTEHDPTSDALRHETSGGYSCDRTVTVNHHLEDEDEEFDMEYVLKHLGIQPDTIGWDLQHSLWIADKSR